MDPPDNQAVPGAIGRRRPLPLVSIANTLQGNPDIIGKLKALPAAIEATDKITENQSAIDTVMFYYGFAVGTDDDLLVSSQNRARRELVGNPTRESVTRYVFRSCGV